MSRRWLILLLAWLAASPLHAEMRTSGESLWSVLRSGSQVILLRHAVTEPGIGDPPGFMLGQCSTQRNLSDRGRADAKRLGQAFRAHRIPVQQVLSSRWCRCIDTAQLAFGQATPDPMLDSMFNDTGNREKTRAVLAAIGRHTGPGNLVLVTHAANIQALTGVSPASGEMIVVRMQEAGRLGVIGRLALSE